MNRSAGMAIVMVCATTLGSWFLAPAFADDMDDAAKLLLDSSRLLSERQEVEAKLAASQARAQELELERRRAKQQAEQINNERQADQSTCGLLGYQYTHLAECEQSGAQLSTRSADVDHQKYEAGRQLETTNSEVELLKARQEQLERQAEMMELKFKRLELSGTAQECVSRLPKDNLESAVAAYQQCWDGTSSAEPRFKPEQKGPPALKSAEPGPKERKKRPPPLPE